MGDFHFGTLLPEWWTDTNSAVSYSPIYFMSGRPYVKTHDPALADTPRDWSSRSTDMMSQVAVCARFGCAKGVMKELERLPALGGLGEE